MLPDTRILTRHREHCVLWERQAIVFKDGSTLELHAVRKLAIDDTFLRAIRFDEHWFVFDLRAIRKSLALDIAQAPPRDISGVVLYTLREAFATSGDFLERLLANYLAIWIADVDEQAPQLRLELTAEDALSCADAAAIRRYLASRPNASQQPYLRRSAA
jgi:hypothetical protein